ncbi:MULTISPECIES: glycosyltransferase [Thiorhodovibrio]|uniref:glycosyltransferase n=1 Tax=Thiorhodovibrio TaxID=61593 RepID=UPI00191362EE|nr:MULTISPECIES: glycosyltransferase [Thiorhodovibrio]MBK5968835.1 glycosyl transferase family 1 [Thiorhodovibrio winogradskyi]WPL12605.1 Glycosyltransferase KanE [Thiorhodovibrio litoralis]
MLNPDSPNRRTQSALAQQEPRSGAPLRVAIVSDAAPERNGVGAYYRDLSEHLRDAGVLVQIISPRYRNGRWYGGFAVPLPGDRTQKFMLPSPLMIRRRLRRINPDAVVIPTPGPYGMLGLLFAKRHRTRIIVGFHTHFERLAAMNQDWSARMPFAQWYLNGCNRKLFRDSHLVLANSHEMVETARDIGAEQVGLMGTSIPRRFITQPPKPLGDTLKRVLFAGRLAPEKNLEAVVDAAEALPEMEFLVAGEGPMRPWLETQTQRLGNITLLGWVPRQKILPLIDSVDALVLPSTVESFGTIALEAMARARLVVVSAHCGILSWDQLNRGLFRIETDEVLADTLRRIADLKPDARHSKAAIARAAARDINARNLSHWLDILRDGRLTGIDATP